METTAKRKRVYLGLSVSVALVLCVLWFWVNAPRSTQPRYTIRRLVAPRFESTRPLSINEQGEVVGHASNAVGGEANFIWDRNQNPTRIDLTVEGTPWLMKLDNRGHALGHVSREGNVLHSFVWSASKGMEKIDASEDDRGYVRDLNDLGMMAGATRPKSKNSYATIWNESLVPTQVSDSSSTYAMLINNRGVVFGVDWRKGSFLADASQIRPLEDWGVSYSVTDMNDYEQVVGMVFSATGGRVAKDNRAFIWNATEGTRFLGDLYGFETYASAINNKGEVVGWAQPPDGNQPSRFMSGVIDFVRARMGQGPYYWQGWQGSAAFLWEDGELIDLNDVVDLGPRWSSLCQATDINEEGEIIGIGIHHAVAPGLTTGFLLSPIEKSGGNNR